MIHLNSKPNGEFTEKSTVNKEKITSTHLYFTGLKMKIHEQFKSGLNK